MQTGVHPRKTVGLGLPDVKLPLGLIAPHHKALAEFKTFRVFIALAFGLPYHLHVSCLIRILFSGRCASGGLKLRRFNGNGL
jgi:hypothetical protein